MLVLRLHLFKSTAGFTGNPPGGSYTIHSLAFVFALLGQPAHQVGLAGISNLTEVGFLGFSLGFGGCRVEVKF